jgi:hypothetical protein
MMARIAILLLLAGCGSAAVDDVDWSTAPRICPEDEGCGTPVARVLALEATDGAEGNDEDDGGSCGEAASQAPRPGACPPASPKREDEGAYP